MDSAGDLIPGNTNQRTGPALVPVSLDRPDVICGHLQ
jgi:hypothetical protein